MSIVFKHMYFFGSALQFLAYYIHDARLYGSVVLSCCIAALCALHAVFFLRLLWGTVVPPRFCLNGTGI